MTLRSIFEKITGRRIVSGFPRGVDFYQDFENSIEDFKPKVVFDVGANVGQSAKEFRKHWSNAKIYSFEPVPSTFADLKKETELDKNIFCFSIGLGAKQGTASFLDEGASDRHRLTESPKGSIEVQTLDKFCKDQGISEISFIKIDTEGGDLEVLKGATDLLRRQCIDAIQVEAGMNQDNKLHVPFSEFQKFLAPYGYFLFGIYDQISEWEQTKPYLRRTNPIFISSKLIERS